MTVSEIITKYFPYLKPWHIIQQENVRRGYALMGSINTEWANL